MVLHEDSIEEANLNQIKSAFQTVIQIGDTKLNKNEQLLCKLNKKIYKYDMKIKQRSSKLTSKVTFHVRILFIYLDQSLFFLYKFNIKEETIYLNDQLNVEKVEKKLQNSKAKQKDNEVDNDDPLKGLTFNVHLNSDDLEAKKNLVLPYEIIG